MPVPPPRPGPMPPPLPLPTPLPVAGVGKVCAVVDCALLFCCSCESVGTNVGLLTTVFSGEGLGPELVGVGDIAGVTAGVSPGRVAGLVLAGLTAVALSSCRAPQAFRKRIATAITPNPRITGADATAKFLPIPLVILLRLHRLPDFAVGVRKSGCRLSTNNFRMRLYSSAQLASRSKPWSSTG